MDGDVEKEVNLKECRPIVEEGVRSSEEVWGKALSFILIGNKTELLCILKSGIFRPITCDSYLFL